MGLYLNPYSYLALNVSRLSAGHATGLHSAFDWFGGSGLPALFRVNDPIFVRLTLLVTFPFSDAIFLLLPCLSIFHPFLHILKPTFSPATRHGLESTQMAILPQVGFRDQESTGAGPVDVEAWTEEATQSLSAVPIASPQTLRGTTASLAIPLDEPKDKATAGNDATNVQDASSAHPRREPLRRDSLSRREALLKGKEGSRQRRRWENGR